MDKTWETFSVPDGHDRAISVGDLDLRFVAADQRVRVHLDGRALDPVLYRTGWQNVSLPELHEIQILPRTPDLPVVLRSDEPIALAVNARLTVEVFLPLWVEILHLRTSGRREESGVLFDLPTKALKRSWFGTPESGEVAYSWRFIPLSRQLYQRHTVAVPVTIVNRSSSVLKFERFLLRAIHLGVYQERKRLVTNGVTVAFKGSEQLSQISFESHETMLQRGNVMRSAPREHTNSDIIRKSFAWLRDLTV